MATYSQCFVEWKELFVSKERGKRVVHYFLKDITGESVLAVVGTERSIRHMFYVVAEEFLKAHEAHSAVNAGYRWRSRREVVNWLTSMLSKQHRQGEHSKSPKSDHISGVGPSYQNRLPRNLKLRAPDIVWSGVAWTCGKQLQHFPAFCRNGVTIAVQSFVFVMAEEEKRHLAYLEDMYEDRKGQKKVKVRWFHHNQEVQGVVTLKNPHPKEVFITPYAQVISVECVDGPAIVMTREHYERCFQILPEDLLTRVHHCSRQFKNNRVKPFKLSKLGGYFDQPIFSILDTYYLEDEDGDNNNNDNDNNNVKLGVKRPRSLRGGRQVGPCEPSNMNVKYEMLRRRLIPKYVKSDNSVFKVNEKIELLCQDSGIRGCWFRCTVLQVSRRQLKVQYDDLKDEDGGGKLEEWVSALRSAMPDKLGMRCSGRPTMRPAHVENETENENENEKEVKAVAFEVGSAVDAWWSDGWWEGVVIGISNSGDGLIQVYVPSETLFLELHRKDIRVSRDWVGDHWVDLESNPNILSSIPVSQKTIKHEILPISPLDTPDPGSLPVPVETINDNKPPLQEGNTELHEKEKESHEKEKESHEKEKDPSLSHDDDNNVEIGKKDENGEEMECETSKENLEANPVQVSA